MSLSKDEALAAASRAYADPVWFCQFFLPHLFPKPIPWFQRAILAVLTRQTAFLTKYGELGTIIENFVYTDRAEQVRPVFTQSTPGTPLLLVPCRYTLIMVPRGFSKTTTAGIAVPLRNILYRDVPFTVYVSEAAPHAKMQLNNVKRELESNERIHEVFGTLKPEMRDPEKWTEEFFETVTGAAMAARGRGGQIRGLNHRGHRPSLIICDDLEDKESVSTDLQRIKVREWAYSDLMPALPAPGADPNAGIVALGTLLHEDALLQTWAQDPEWTVVRLGAYDAAGEPLWPEFFSAAVIEAKKQSFARAGQLHNFYLEYMNQPHAPETQIFRPEWVTVGEVGDVVASATYIDPAFSKNRGSDDTVIVTCSITKRGTVLVRDMWGKLGASEQEKLDEFFRQVKLYGCRRAGVESTAAQVAFAQLLRENMFRFGSFFEVVEVKHQTKKTERIKSVLQPRYASGHIVHTRRFPKLETQLYDFRMAGNTHEDWPDALAGCIVLLDPWAAMAAGQDLTANEFKPLREELGPDLGMWAGRGSEDSTRAVRAGRYGPRHGRRRA